MPRPLSGGPSGGSADNRPAVHLLIPTHTTRHLGACVAALGAQTTMPRSIVVSCDTDDPRIAALLDETWPGVAAAIEARGLRPPRLLLARRPHQGEARLNQVRNNGLRALEGAGGLSASDLVVVLDGDTVLAPDALERHSRLETEGYELIVPYRCNLDQQATAALAPDGVLVADFAGRLPALLTREERDRLEARERRYRRQLWLSRFAGVLSKPHKPKVLGGHHAVSVRVLLAVNGYDEQYVGYGYDDDDLSRRVHALRPRPRVAIAVHGILAFHLWHPTRAPQRPTDAPGHARFAERHWPVSARHGWRNPCDQPPPQVGVIGEAGRSPGSAAPRSDGARS